jgi:hypothetical protein
MGGAIQTDIFRAVCGRSLGFVPSPFASDGQVVLHLIRPGVFFLEELE